MVFRVLILFSVFVSGIVRAETDISAPEAGDERQETTSDQEWESRDIIPQGADDTSSHHADFGIAGKESA